MSASNIIMYLLPVIVTPILTRLYEQEDFGDWGVFSGFITIANIGLFAGLENTIVKARTHADASNLCVLCFITSILIISMIAVCFLIGGWLGIQFFTTFPASRLLVIYLFLYSCYTILYNLSNRCEKYTSLAFTNMVQGGSQAVFRILFGTIGITIFNGLILGTTIAQAMSTLFLIITLISVRHLFPLANIKLKRMKELLVEYRHFIVYDAPSSILAFAAFNLPVLILASFFNRADIGCYSVVIQLLLMPMSFVGAAMGRVYYQQLSGCHNDDARLQQVTRKVMQIVMLISIMPLLFLACGGDKIVVLFLGAKWSSAGTVALCLALWSFPTILTQPLMPLFRHTDKLRMLLAYNGMYFIGGIGVLTMCCYITDNLYHILLIYSVVCCVIKFALFLRILSIARLSITITRKVLPLWLFAIAILIIRLTGII